MRFGPMLRQRGVFAWPAAARVRSHALALIQDFYRGPGVADIDLFAYQLVGNAVIMLFPLDRLPFLELANSAKRIVKLLFPIDLQ